MKESPVCPHPFETLPNPEEEAQQIQTISDLTIELLKRRYQGEAPILRGVHAKSHGCVLARFHGGQGSLNVPSWSRDGAFIAFVSYEPAN